MTEQEKKFYERYHEPFVDDYIQGYSGIDPALKVNASEINHELLDNLMGGDETGHYHLTYEQIKKLDAYSEKYPPTIDDNQVIYCTASEEITPYEITGIDVRKE